MSRNIPASEYMGYDKYIGDEDTDVDIPIKHESKPYLMIPFPDNATNGDVMKIIFDVAESIDLSWGEVDCLFGGDSNTHYFDLNWWRAPYKRR